MNPLDSDLAGLPELSARQLRAAWRTLRCGEPMAPSSRDLMVREIAYKMQERVHGGLAPAVKRRLRALAQETESNEAGALARLCCSKPVRGCCGNGADARTPLSSSMTASSTTASGIAP